MDKKEKIIALWYRTVDGTDLLKTLEDCMLVARIRQRGIEGAVDASTDDTLDYLLKQLEEV